MWEFLFGDVSSLFWGVRWHTRSLCLWFWFSDATVYFRRRYMIIYRCPLVGFQSLCNLARRLHWAKFAKAEVFVFKDDKREIKANWSAGQHYLGFKTPSPASRRVYRIYFLDGLISSGKLRSQNDFSLPLSWKTKKLNIDSWCGTTGWNYPFSLLSDALPPSLTCLFSLSSARSLFAAPLFSRRAPRRKTLCSFFSLFLHSPSDTFTPNALCLLAVEKKLRRDTWPHSESPLLSWWDDSLCLYIILLCELNWGIFSRFFLPYFLCRFKEHPALCRAD